MSSKYCGTVHINKGQMIKKNWQMYLFEINGVPDQLASEKPADQDLHCLQLYL